MTLPRSVADVVSRHVLFEVESIDPDVPESVCAAVSAGGRGARVHPRAPRASNEPGAVQCTTLGAPGGVCGATRQCGNGDPWGPERVIVSWVLLPLPPGTGSSGRARASR